MDRPINKAIFNNNTATSYGGGAIYNGASGFSINNSVFINNQAKSSKYGGGAIYNNRVNFTIINSTFINNTANEYGAGAIYNGEYIMEELLLV